MAARVSLDFVAQLAPLGRQISPAVQLDYSADLLQKTATLLASVSRLVVTLYWNGAFWQFCPKAYPEIIPSGPAAIDLDGVTCNSAPLTLQSLLDTIKSQKDAEKVGHLPVIVIVNLSDLNGTRIAGAAAPTQLGVIVSAFPGVFTASDLLKGRQAGLYDSAYNSLYGQIVSPPFPSAQTLRAQGYSLIVGFGNTTISPARGYDISKDSDIIFSAAELGGIASLTTANLTLTSDLCARPNSRTYMNGTGFDLLYTKYHTNSTISPSDLRLSWSFASIRDSVAVPFTPALTSLVVSCGFSPLFTTSFSFSLLNAAAWAWAPDEPATSLASAAENCVALSAGTGRWYMDDCLSKFPCSCQTMSDPYSWILTDQRQFRECQGACPPLTAFAVPKTPIELSNLIPKILSATPQTNSWINLSRSALGCWSTNGTSTCAAISVIPTYLAV